MSNTHNPWAGSGNHNEDCTGKANNENRRKLLSDGRHYVDAAGHIGSYDNPYEVDGYIRNH